MKINDLIQYFITEIKSDDERKDDIANVERMKAMTAGVRGIRTTTQPQPKTGIDTVHDKPRQIMSTPLKVSTTPEGETVHVPDMAASTPTGKRAGFHGVMDAFKADLKGRTKVVGGVEVPLSSKERKAAMSTLIASQKKLSAETAAMTKKGSPTFEPTKQFLATEPKETPAGKMVQDPVRVTGKSKVTVVDPEKPAKITGQQALKRRFDPAVDKEFRTGTHFSDSDETELAKRVSDVSTALAPPGGTVRSTKAVDTSQDFGVWLKGQSVGGRKAGRLPKLGRKHHLSGKAGRVKRHAEENAARAAAAASAVAADVASGKITGPPKKTESLNAFISSLVEKKFSGIDPYTGREFIGRDEKSFDKQKMVTHTDKVFDVNANRRLEIPSSTPEANWGNTAPKGRSSVKIDKQNVISGEEGRKAQEAAIAAGDTYVTPVDQRLTPLAQAFATIIKANVKKEKGITRAIKTGIRRADRKRGRIGKNQAVSTWAEPTPTASTPTATRSTPAKKESPRITALKRTLKIDDAVNQEFINKLIEIAQSATIPARKASPRDAGVKKFDSAHTIIKDLKSKELEAARKALGGNSEVKPKASGSEAFHSLFKK